MTAAAALFLAVSAAVFRWGLRTVRWPWSLAAVVLGTLMALPQLVEFVRILPLTFRGHWGFTFQQATVASWDPVTSVELGEIPVALAELGDGGFERFRSERCRRRGRLSRHTGTSVRTGDRPPGAQRPRTAGIDRGSRTALGLRPFLISHGSGHRANLLSDFY